MQLDREDDVALGGVWAVSYYSGVRYIHTTYWKLFSTDPAALPGFYFFLLLELSTNAY